MDKKSLEDQDIEKRLSARKKLHTIVKVVNKDTEFREETVNYSLTGLFVKCNLPDQYELNNKVDVSFVDENGIAQNHTGKIVRKSEKGIAVHYLKRANYI
ncbi:MAG: PilZ domain-containing protein [Desulfobacteraceae bacterium]|nr:PilZ domain-containing protein [Desulfobacteraceae bacterium]